MKTETWLVTVIVTPKAKENRVSYVSYEDNLIRVRVTEPPENNKANKAVVVVLSEHFSIGSHEIVLLFGQASKYKKFLLPRKLKKNFKTFCIKEKETREIQGDLFDL